MDKNNIKRLVAALLRESHPSPEHERLKMDLATWALRKGYTRAYSQLPNKSEPDVLRVSKNNLLLFIGDAKNSQHETVDNSDTVSRIQTYFNQFASFLGTYGYKGGRLAIATNKANEAVKWIPTLNILATAARITSGTGTPPNFKAVKLAQKATWIIYW